MYPVSDAYTAAWREKSVVTRMTGTVGGKAFADKNIVSGTFSVTNQCSDGSDILIGQVYAGELRAVFRGVGISRYGWMKKAVVPYFGILLPDGSWEDIPLGVFRVAEAGWTGDGMSVTAYDDMVKFDRKFKNAPGAGTAHAWAAAACSACGVALATTEDAMRKFPNGRRNLRLWKENDIETWRDLLSWVAQALCAVATMNRDGALEFRQYAAKAAGRVAARHRAEGAEFADYETEYTGVSYVDAAAKVTRYTGADEDDGLTYNLGTSPFFQAKSTAPAMASAVLSGLQKAKSVPFSAAVIGNPGYDLCDRVTFSDGRADGDASSLVTRYEFRYRGSFQMEGAGGNPALASAKSKTDKNIAGLMSETSSALGGSVQVFTYTGPAAVSAGAGEWAVASEMRYGADKDGACVYHGMAEVTLSEGASVTARYTVDGEADAGYMPAGQFAAGRRLVPLMYFWQHGEEAGIGEFRAELSVSAGTLRAGKGMCRGYVLAQGSVDASLYMEGIEVKALPLRTVYAAGDALSYAGLSVAAVYSDGTEKDVTELCVFSPAEGGAASGKGVLTVEVSYTEYGTEYETSFALEVRDREYLDLRYVLYRIDHGERVVVVTGLNFDNIIADGVASVKIEDMYMDGLGTEYEVELGTV